MAARSLAAKHSVPTAPRGLVQRQRLLARVDEGAVRRLTLVSAPAGSGKTTLLAHFASATRLPVAWVSLDERDDDPHRFWGSVVDALSRLQLDSAPPALSDVADDALLEWVDEVMLGIPGDFLLVLDDYHQISSPVLHRGITFLLDYAPPTMHLAIATRRDPPLPLGVLRARDQLVEIRAGDLSFTSGESASLLQAIVGPVLPPEAVEALHESTEGWAASLQLAGVAMRGRPNLLEVARGFSGTHRYVVDYLADEVLLRQPPDLRQFLLETSILDRLCGPLCDAVTERSGGQATLEAIERGNLLLVPLGDDRRWYRYHHLFAEFLRARLEETAAERQPGLHRRAAAWFEGQGDAAKAFEHWLAAGDVGEAARLAEAMGRDVLRHHGEVTRLSEWLERLPSEIVDERPLLVLLQAWLLAFGSQATAVKRRLDRVEELIAAAGSPSGTEWRALRGEATTIRAQAEARFGEPERARDLAQAALRDLPESEQALRSFAYQTLAGANLLLDDAPAAETAYREALAIGQESGNYHVVCASLHSLIEILMRRGRLREAMASCQAALRGDGFRLESLLASAELHADAADVLYQWNDLEAAADFAERAVTLSRRYGLHEVVLHCQISLAVISRALGRLDRAMGLFADVERLIVSGRLRHRQAEHRWAALRLRWWTDEGQLGRAASLAVELGLTEATAPTYHNESQMLGLGRLLRAEGRAAEAAALLDRLARSAAAAGRAGRQIEARILGAMALADQRDLPAALASLREALVLAEPEGYVRVFLDEGPPLSRLLEQARGTLEPTAADYARRLLAAFGEGESGPAKASSLAEPLSRRELEILDLIARGKTYQEIARELIVAVSTVQHHVRSLYPKLDAHSGLEAVARARQLGLLP